MKPTNELRFVKREVGEPVQPNMSIWTFRTTRILQQKWAGEVSTGPLKTDTEHKEEWRDVPVEKETP